MSVTRNAKALAGIEKALEAVYDDKVTTTHSLLMCQEIAQLLDIEKEKGWIECELAGYPPPPIRKGSSSEWMSIFWSGFTLRCIQHLSVTI